MQMKRLANGSRYLRFNHYLYYKGLDISEYLNLFLAGGMADWTKQDSDTH